MPRQYHDFYLELRDLDETADTFKVAVLSSSAGETREAITVPYRYKELKTKLKALEDKSISDTPEDLVILGKGLADRLLPIGKARNLFQGALNDAETGSGVRLRLRISHPKLAQIPWEFSYLQADEQKGEFMTLNPKISIVRHEAQPKKYSSPMGEHPEQLRLVIAMVPEVKGYDELDLQKEKGVIETALYDFRVKGISLEHQMVVNPSTTDLQKVLQPKTDLFHFAGHGEFKENVEIDPQTREPIGQGSLVLIQNKTTQQPDLLNDEELAGYLTATGVRVAILGACRTGRRDEVSPWAGVAASLVQHDIPVVISMQYKVRDPHAIAFSEMFYTSLASGLSVDEAVSAGRLAMRGKDEQNVEWGVPVLYMRSEDGVIFPQLTERESEVAEQISRVIQQTIEIIENGSKVVGIRIERSNGSFQVVQKFGRVSGSRVIGAEIKNAW